MNISKHSIKTPNETDLDEMGRVYLKSLGLKSLPTPYKTIDFEALTKRALQHLAPFEAALKYKDDKEPTDKGYKDGLIAQTIYQFSQKKAGKGEAVVVLSGDKRFIEYIKELFESADNLIVVDTVNQLQNDLELKIKGLSSALSEDAAKLFYKANDYNSVFYAAKIREQIQNFYSSYFPNVKAGAARLDALPNLSPYLGSVPGLLGASDLEFGTQAVYLKDTSFQGRDGVLLSWSTKLELRQDYTAQVLGITITPANVTVQHRVTFRVNWSTRLQANKTLSGPLFISLEPLDEEKYYNQPSYIYTGNLLSGSLGTTGFSTTGFGGGLTTAQSAVSSITGSDLHTFSPSLTQPSSSKPVLLGSSYLSPSNQLLELNKSDRFWDYPPPPAQIAES